MVEIVIGVARLECHSWEEIIMVKQKVLPLLHLLCQHFNDLIRTDLAVQV